MFQKYKTNSLLAICLADITKQFLNICRNCDMSEMAFHVTENIRWIKDIEISTIESNFNRDIKSLENEILEYLYLCDSKVSKYFINGFEVIINDGFLKNNSPLKKEEKKVYDLKELYSFFKSAYTK